MKKFYLLLVLLSLVPLCVAYATEVHLVDTRLINNASISQHIEPILDANRQLEGFALSDTSKVLRLVWLDGRPEDSIPLSGWPHKTINYCSGDTIYLYVFAELSENYDYFGTDPRLIRIAYYQGSWTINEVIPQLYRGVPWEEYMSSSSAGERLEFAFDSLEHVNGVIFQERVYWHGYAFTIGAHDVVNGASIVYSPDLSTRILRTLADLAIPAHLTTDSVGEYLTAGLEYVYQAAWCEGCPPIEWYGASIKVVDSSGAIKITYQRESAAFEDIFVGDFSPASPLDEVIIYGSRPIIDSFLPTQDHLICYNFANGEREQVWYHPMEPAFVQHHLWLKFYYHEQNALVGTSQTNIFFLNCRTGSFTDSAAVGRNLSTAHFYASGVESSGLEMFTRSNDTVFVYRFDAITDTPADDPPTPSSFTLSQNYPNPFNASTEINFSLARTGDVHLTVYNLLGQEVKTLVDGRISAGEHRVTWDGSDNQNALCATGVYLYRLQIEDRSESRKMLLLK